MSDIIYYLKIFSPSFYKDNISLVAQLAKNLLAMQEIQVRSLDQEDPLEEGMATHSSILAYRSWLQSGYSPRGDKESDTAELLALPFQKVIVPSFRSLLISGRGCTV